MPHISQNSLIEQIKSGDRKYLEQLYLEQGPVFVNWLKKHYQCSQEEAVETYQESILIFCQNIINGKLIQLNCTIQTYLFAIGKNVLLSKRRKINLREVALSEEQEWIPDDTSLEVGMDLDEKQQRLLYVIGKLGKKCQFILKAFYLQEQPLKKIAQSLGYKSMDVVYTQKKRCVQQLRKLIKAHYSRDDF